MLKTEQILNAKFTPISKGTYNAEEVDEFLKIVAESYEQLQNEKIELIKKISILADKIESYRNDEEAIKLSLLDAHKMAENISKNSKEKSEAIISEAENKASDIKAAADYNASQTVNEAREQAKSIVDNAKSAVAALTERAQSETQKSIVSAQQKAEEIIADANSQAEEIIGNSKTSYIYYTSELAKLKDKTDKFKTTVAALCNSQLGLLNSIPELEIEETSVVDVIPEVEDFAGEETEIFEEAAFEEPEAVIEEFSEIPEAEDEVSDSVEEAIEEYVEEEIIEESEEAEIVEESEEIKEAEEEVLDSNLDELLDFLNASTSEAVEIEDIASDLDDFLPEIKEDVELTEEAEEETLDDASEETNEEDVLPEMEEESPEDDDDDDDFQFDPNSLDGIVFDDKDIDGEDEDITSLFDSLFDE